MSKADLIPLLVDHVQAWCILQGGAVKAAPQALARAVAATMRREDSEVVNLLFDDRVTAGLRSRNVALWRGADKNARLVSLEPPSRRAAAARVQHHPGGSACRWCLMSEHVGPLTSELAPDTDAHGDRIAASYVHPACMSAWRRCKRLAAQENPDYAE